MDLFEISIFAYFKNFVLIACFLGFGLGCYLSRQRINLAAMSVPLVTLVLICDLPVRSLRAMLFSLPNLIGASSQTNIWDIPSFSSNMAAVFQLVIAAVFAALVFALIAFVFVPIGQLVACIWKTQPTASLDTRSTSWAAWWESRSTLAFAFFRNRQLPGSCWQELCSLLFWNLSRLQRTVTAGTFLICVGVSFLGQTADRGTVYWSPYQKLIIQPIVRTGQIVSYQLTTNSSWYQQILNLSPGFVASHSELFRDVPVEWNAYNLPYHFYLRPPSVLVLGAGTGNDVAAALRNGAARVVAVEIDPLILHLGRQLHFEKPYSSPHVHIVVDDARSYIQNSSERFDLIVFSLLDSHTNSSYYLNIRIDNYVYTVEALKAAKRLLKPDGLMIIKFQAITPWIAGRLRNLALMVFGRPPLQFESGAPSYATRGRFFINGSSERIAQALHNPQLSAYVAQHGNIPVEKASLTTDIGRIFTSANLGYQRR